MENSQAQNPAGNDQPSSHRCRRVRRVRPNQAERIQIRRERRLANRESRREVEPILLPYRYAVRLSRAEWIQVREYTAILTNRQRAQLESGQQTQNTTDDAQPTPRHRRRQAQLIYIAEGLVAYQERERLAEQEARSRVAGDRPNPEEGPDIEAVVEQSARDTGATEEDPGHKCPDDTDE